MSLPPGAKGTYALFFQLSAPQTIQVGRLGSWTLPAGCVVYVGSAMGSGGLRARLARHFRTRKRRHWHIDALSTVLPPVAAVFRCGDERWECRWAQQLARAQDALIPVPGLGSSDCHAGCRAHLIAFPASHHPLSTLLLTNPPHSLLYCERMPILSLHRDSIQLHRIACPV